MLIESLSTFPEIFDSYMNCSIMKIAQDKKIVEYQSHNLRDWTTDIHHKTDDKPYGGGCGQLMMCEPIYKAYNELCDKNSLKPCVVIPAPNGEVLNDAKAKKLSEKDRLLFICGHYEGIDQRVFELADEVISIGDYVVSSGELASLVVIDSVVRKLPGVLGAENGAYEESFVDGLLEYPQYTRPSEFMGMKVPEVLLSGNHEKIDQWRKKESIERTKKYRPDLYKKYINKNN